MQNPIFDFAKVEKIWRRSNEIGQQLLEQDPSIGFAMAVVKGGDLANAEETDKEYRAGKIDFDEALGKMGSYAKFDWAFKKWQRNEISDAKLFKILPELWSSSDPDDTNPDYLEIWKRARKKNGANIITDNHKDTSLPIEAEYTIYRGQDRDAEVTGIAWTLDVNVAKKFARGAWARQSDRDGVILRGTIRRNKILGYLTGRGESEIVVDPADVKDVVTLEIKEALHG